MTSPTATNPTMSTSASDTPNVVSDVTTSSTETVSPTTAVQSPTRDGPEVTRTCTDTGSATIIAQSLPVDQHSDRLQASNGLPPGTTLWRDSAPSYHRFRLEAWLWDDFKLDKEHQHASRKLYDQVYTPTYHIPAPPSIIRVLDRIYNLVPEDTDGFARFIYRLCILLGKDNITDNDLRSDSLDDFLFR
ncbi:hypothetical protein M011DRAFT_314899 [Sporormia fimetaria CBS 119925]|uniref:Uncharacterized protein n=1 Tax=Sporormia fimetaria CBS 119925 TaxID=1340428 RepID=A0A6A6UUS8_9PLEO|nr:hypothetical protein M011DRAFT_314899 [Sporormia fimetaria CBS 119925]